MKHSEVEPFDRGEWVDAAARAMFVSAWADNMEEHGVSFSGMELMDEAPNTPLAARQAARALGRAYEKANGRKLKSLWKLAATVPGKHYSEPTVHDFGHYLAMQSLGHGVGWEDDHPAFPLVTPQAEFYVFDSDITWEVDDTGRLDSPNREARKGRGRRRKPARRNPGRRMVPNGKVLGQLGDVNPIEYGGGIVYETDYGPELAYTHGLEVDYTDRELPEDEDDAVLLVYRVDLESSGEDLFNFYDWTEWDGVASYIGMEPAELKQYAKSADPMARASVVEAIASYYGWHEVDSYPVEMTVRELDKLWFPGGYLAKKV